MNPVIKKAALLLFITVLVAGFFHFDLQQFLTLEGIKEGLDRFKIWFASQPLLVGGGFLLFYIMVTALSLPGAAIMTLAAGALFGLLWGVVIVSFASTIGATVAFLVSRYLLRNSVQHHFGDRLKSINEGMEKDGAFYLFTLRLVPVFPFFLINLLMGLTPIRTATFYWVSQLGMLAGTIVYVNAGTRLADIDDISDILSPLLIFSFILLGLFPLLAKKLLALLKSWRLYREYKKPSGFDRNLIVIGAGAGGLVSAYIASVVRAKVTLVEAHKMGGDCLNYGCIPSKTLIKSARMVQQIRQAELHGIKVSGIEVSFKKVMERINDVIEQVAPHDSVERYAKLGVEVIHGYARLIDPWTVEIQGNDGTLQRLTSRAVVLATGAQPLVPPLPGLEDIGYVTSDTVWKELAKLDEAPERLLIMGGGAIGCELAQSLARLGSKVTQIEMAQRIMIREDEEVSRMAQKSLESDGVKVLTDHKALRCEIIDGKKYLVVAHRGEEKQIEFDLLLCAVGRVARLKGYGLEKLGIDTERRIITNRYLETIYPNIYAAGDVVGNYQFTHTAAHEAWYATVNALFGQFRKFKADYSVIPWTTFIDPEIARVGLNEEEAKAKGIPYEVTRYNLDNLDRAITDGMTTGFIKVLTKPGKDRILGVTIVGQNGGDLIAEFVLAMKHGLGLNKILGTIHIYPTWAEANKYAAGEWKRAHAPQKILSLLEKYHSWRRGA